MKEIILVTSLALSGLLVIMRGSESFREACNTMELCSRYFEFIHNVLLFVPIILIFSLITYKMRDSAFSPWWKFARIAIPVIFAISIVINMGFHHTVGGFMNTSDALDIPAHILLYAIFGVGSVVQIYRGRRASSSVSSGK